MNLRSKIVIFILSCTVIAYASVAGAATINISLNPDDWNRDTGYDQQAPGSLDQTADGHLIATKTTATGGTGWAVDVQSDASYNLQGATLKFKWKYNGQGSYAGLYTGTLSGTRTLMHELYTTHHTWLYSKLITSDKWYFTEITYIDSVYTITVTSDNGTEDSLCRTSDISADYWDKLADTHFWFRIVDNYVPNVYFELAEATVIQPDPVPVPAAVWLLGSGLLGLSGFRKKFRKKTH